MDKAFKFTIGGVLFVYILSNLFIYNNSPSMPVGIYSRSLEELEIGSIVTIKMEKNGQITRIIKKICGLVGDAVIFDDSQVFINDQVVGSIPNSYTGEHLVSNQVIESGKAYLCSDHPHSWDSRYFGVVDIRKIRGIYEPFWVK